MQEQAARFGTGVKYLAKITAVGFSTQPFRIILDSGDSIESCPVIIATGAYHWHLGVPSEPRIENKGVTYCAMRDGALPAFRNKSLVVVASDSTCEKVLYLTRFSSIVYLVHRRDTLRASRVMAERTLSNPKIQPVWNSMADNVFGGEEVRGVGSKETVIRELSTLGCSGVFVTIGHVPGVFVAGDCADFVYSRAITAADMGGCIAATAAERFLALQPSS